MYNWATYNEMIMFRWKSKRVRANLKKIGGQSRYFLNKLFLEKH